MKKYIISLLMSMVVLGAYSQQDGALDGKTARELSKQKKLEQRRDNEAAMAKLVDSLVQNRRFVLQANFLSNQSGYRVLVDDGLNFIIVDSMKITIQIASTNRVGGANGLGGITTNGTLSSFDVKKVGKTKDNYMIRMFANTPLGSYDIFLNVSPNSNADASISGNTSGKLNYHGVIRPIQRNRVYKGMSIG